MPNQTNRPTWGDILAAQRAQEAMDQRPPTQMYDSGHQRVNVPGPIQYWPQGSVRTQRDQAKYNNRELAATGWPERAPNWEDLPQRQQQMYMEHAAPGRAKDMYNLVKDGFNNPFSRALDNAGNWLENTLDFAPNIPPSGEQQRMEMLRRLELADQARRR